MKSFIYDGKTVIGMVPFSIKQNWIVYTGLFLLVLNILYLIFTPVTVGFSTGEAGAYGAWYLGTFLYTGLMYRHQQRKNWKSVV